MPPEPVHVVREPQGPRARRGRGVRRALRRAGAQPRGPAPGPARPAGRPRRALRRRGARRGRGPARPRRRRLRHRPGDHRPAHPRSPRRQAGHRGRQGRGHPQAARAKELGAAGVVTAPDEVEALHGRFDVVFETAGTAAAVTTGTRLLGRGGRLICVGLPAEQARFSSAQLSWNEQTIVGSRAYDVSTWASVPARLGAAPGLESIVTHTVHLSDHRRALELVESRQATKVLLHP
ncbi:zinc-binding dehydrogenase [Nonomuraea thailandensis]